MTLQSSGLITAQQINVELNRANTAQFNINGGAERALAGIPSGSISFSNFYGKTREIIATVAADSDRLVIQNFFSAADWAGPATKVFIIPVGRTVYSSTYVSPALSSGTGRGGLLRIENYGNIFGGPGLQNGGIGGDAFYTQQDGVTIYNYSQIYAGGGGGGAGGQGGPGFYQTPSTVTAELTPGYPTNIFQSSGGNGSFGLFTIAGNTTAQTNPFTSGIYTYTASRLYSGQFYYINRSYTVYTTTNTTGGVGGSGGWGTSWNGGSVTGINGSVGGLNAGTGGKGGNGGGWGLSGSNGNAGTSGNNGSGVGGFTGGLAGYAIRNGDGTAIIALAGDMKGR